LILLIVYLVAVASPAVLARRGGLARFLWIELALACLLFSAIISAQSIRWASTRAGSWGRACLQELQFQEDQGNTVFPEPDACEKAREEARDIYAQAQTTAGLLLSLGLGCFLGAAVYRRDERVELTRATWSPYKKAPS